MKEQTIYKLFELSLLGKSVFAVLDLLGCVLLSIFGTNPFVRLVTWLAQGELVEDSNDILANFFLRFSQHYSPGRPMFLIIYLGTHGLINGMLVFGLRQHKHWAYPFALSTLGLFLLYQLYRITLQFSPWLMALTVFDVMVVWLIWHDYRKKVHKVWTHDVDFVTTILAITKCGCWDTGYCFSSDW